MYNTYAMRSFASVKFNIEDFNGNKWEVEGEPGDDIMKIGVKAGVPFEQACGGNAECGTCHIYITEEIMKADDYQEPEDAELDVLDWAEDVKDESRLAC
mmetsp:Transcript_19061/g.13653  ORF Transcript_19061/g.13653 Transcript_19061/m.13653 type:complete len:99 (-) Transcript_19061:92-388(-)